MKFLLLALVAGVVLALSLRAARLARRGIERLRMPLQSQDR